MFTLEQINDIHDEFGNGDTLPQYLQELNSIGVLTYDSYIFDGHSEYFGINGFSLISPPVHAFIAVADVSNQHRFLEHLNLHKEQTTSYLEMSKGLGESGVNRWTIDTVNMSLCYFDRGGNRMLFEAIK